MLHLLQASAWHTRRSQKTDLDPLCYDVVRDFKDGADSLQAPIRLPSFDQPHDILPKPWLRSRERKENPRQPRVMTPRVR